MFFAKYVLATIHRTTNNVYYTPECYNAPITHENAIKYKKNTFFSKETIFLL